MSVSTRSLRIVLCDDHLMLLEGMAAALAARGHVVEAMTVSPHDVIDLVERCHPDVCILDIGFPRGDGISAAAEIRRRSPDTKIMILSGMLAPPTIRRLAEIGVQGMVRKDVGFEDIVRLLESLGDDQVTVDMNLLRETIDPAGSDGITAPARNGVRAFEQLTARECEVLKGIMFGEDTRLIAKRLHISTSTTRTHVQNLLAKLGVHSRLQAAALVMSHGGVAALDRTCSPADPSSDRLAQAD